MLAGFLMFLMLLTSLILIVLVLIQRGKGGGLAGALGGMGGQSAFGTKAGDLFTRITIGVVVFWILLCIISIKLLGGGSSLFDTTMGGAAQTTPGEPGASVPLAPGAGDEGPGSASPPAQPAPIQSAPAESAPVQSAPASSPGSDGANP